MAVLNSFNVKSFKLEDAKISPSVRGVMKASEAGFSPYEDTVRFEGVKLVGVEGTVPELMLVMVFDRPAHKLHSTENSSFNNIHINTLVCILESEQNYKRKLLFQTNLKS